MNDIEQGVARCLVCFGELPCRNHPSPPKLSFAGGTHFEPSPDYKNKETPKPIADQRDGQPIEGTPENVRGDAPHKGRTADDIGGPRSGSTVAPRAGVNVGEAGQDNGPAVPGAVPLRVAEASQRVGSPEINHDAIEIIEGVLERLKSGATTAAAVVEVHVDRSVATHWSETDGSYHHLCSGAARLAFRLTADED